MFYVPNIKIIIARSPFVAILVCGFLANIFPVFGWTQEALSERTAIHDAASEEDEFSELDSLSVGEMSQYSGGTEVSFGDVGVNLATNSATMTGNSVDGNVNTGLIQDLNVNDVGGINSMMFNTGNNVNFQSNIQVNVFVK